MTTEYSIEPWLSNDFEQLTKIIHSTESCAILLYGKANLGKRDLARHIISYDICQAATGKPCGGCNSCVLHNAGTNPDVMEIILDSDASSRWINIDMVRGISTFLSTNAMYSKRKIVLIPQADILNLNASNALLKSIEEPSVSTLFVLVSNSLNKILPTLRSRCIKYHVATPRRHDVLSFYLTHNPHDKTAFWLDFYEKSPKATMVFDMEELEQIIDYLIHPSIDNIFNLSSIFDGKKYTLGFFVEFMLKWLCELEQYRLDLPLHIFQYFSDKLVVIKHKINYIKLNSLFDRLLFLEKWENHPFNYRLQIENVLFKYQQIFVK